MSRSASTDARTEEIVLNLISPNLQAIAYLEVDIDGSYSIVDDLDWDKGINWTDAGKKEKYANFALTPLPGTIGFNVVNVDGKYFPGSGDSLSGVFDLDTKVRLRAGYILDSGSTASQTLNLNDISGQYTKSYFYRTEHSGGTIILDSDGTQSITHFQDIFDNLYDQGAYDSDNYTPDAYTVQTYDSSQPGLEQFNSLSVTANNTGGTIYYRTFDDPNILGVSEFTNWTSAGATVNGTKTVDFTDIEYERFIQVAILYDGISWGDNNIISDISVTIESRFEEIYTSVYYLDSPKFTDPKAPAQPIVNCTGRDAFKKAIGVDIKYSDVNGQYVDDIIKDLADKVGLSYTATSIADLSGFGARTTIAEGNDDVVKAEKLFEQCMQIINPTGYVMYTEYDSSTDDNVLFVQPRPALVDTVGAFSFKNYESIGSMAKNAGKILQRMTVITEDQITRADAQLDTLAISTTGSKTLSWNTTTGQDAVYKRIVVDNPSNITISNLSVEPTSITFTVDSVTGTVNVTAYGNIWDSTTPQAQGEAIDWDNMTLLNGVTSKLENALVLNDAEAKSIAESFVTQYGTPIFQAGSLKWPYLNLIPELNDGYLLWRRFVGGTSADDVYITTKMSHHFDKNNHWTTFNLDDSGSNYSDLGDFIYDDIMDWDKGYVWDMGISSPLTTEAEADVISDAIIARSLNVDFA
jgi:hypothetical protein